MDQDSRLKKEIAIKLRFSEYMGVKVMRAWRW
jgi:hypothetical protein